MQQHNSGTPLRPTVQPPFLTQNSPGLPNFARLPPGHLRVPGVSQLPVNPALTPLSQHFMLAQHVAATQGSAHQVAAAMAATPSTSGQTPQVLNQQLKVEDALSYLDRVKAQFGSQPHVYNQFLDIMKDFKSQSIDTPGVIKRVSQLFHAFPLLIVGFNAFLPSGYKIELIGDVDRPQNILVSCSFPGGRKEIISGVPSGAMLQPTTPAPTLVSPPAQTRPQSKPQQEQTQPSAEEIAVTAAAGQPMEFSQAISYVNKIKERYVHHPGVYKQFLEILHDYQKQQKRMKDASVSQAQRVITESEVYRQVQQLFQGQDDLLSEFSQFLPDAITTTESLAQSGALKAEMQGQPPPTSMSSPREGSLEKQSEQEQEQQSRDDARGVKRQMPTGGDEVEMKVSKEEDFSDLARYGTAEDFQILDKIKRALGSDVDESYQAFLRIMQLFNKDLISKQECIQMVSVLLTRHSQLLVNFRHFLGVDDRDMNVEAIPQRRAHIPQITSDLAMQIDYATCRQNGTSYRALPDAYKRPACTGRAMEENQYCNEVLNDTWVSFPSWLSEDTTTVSSKKTPYEEFMYRTEDERFELDILLETNKATINALEVLLRKLRVMSAEELEAYQVDDDLGTGGSRMVHVLSIKRIYGPAAEKILYGMKHNPKLAAEIVLKRLKAKDDEWREVQRSLNMSWREQCDRNHLKSLDVQANTFKQTDLKLIKSKSLLNQIEVLFDERHEMIEEGLDPSVGPHLMIQYPEEDDVFYDSLDLLIHHVRRQSALSHEEKTGVKRLLKQTLPDLFGKQRGEMSEDEAEPEEDDASSISTSSTGSSATRLARRKARHERRRLLQKSAVANGGDWPRLGYTIIHLPGCWYVFLRLHHLLCERLAKLRSCANDLLVEEQKQTRDNGLLESAADLLMLRTKKHISASEFYPSLLELVKNLLDGQIDPMQFEDSLRDMFTIHAYHVFTVDKLIQAMVRQLQLMHSEDTSTAALRTYEQYRSLGAAGDRPNMPPVEDATERRALEGQYQRCAEQSLGPLLPDQNMFKILFFQHDNRVTFELIDTSGPSEEDATAALDEDMGMEKMEKAVDEVGCGGAYADYMQAECTALGLDEMEVQAAEWRQRPRWLMRHLRSASECSTAASDSFDVVFEGNPSTSTAVNKHRARPGSGFVMRRDGWRDKARKSHRASSERRYQRYECFLEAWANKYISQSQAEECSAWLLDNANRHTIDVCDEPPYHQYVKYTVGEDGDDGEDEDMTDNE